MVRAASPDTEAPFASLRRGGNLELGFRGWTETADCPWRDRGEPLTSDPRGNPSSNLRRSWNSSRKSCERSVRLPSRVRDKKERRSIYLGRPLARLLQGASKMPVRRHD